MKEREREREREKRRRRREKQKRRECVYYESGLVNRREPGNFIKATPMARVTHFGSL